jgi:hypothetical protein
LKCLDGTSIKEEIQRRCCWSFLTLRARRNSITFGEPIFLKNFWDFFPTTRAFEKVRFRDAFSMPCDALHVYIHVLIDDLQHCIQFCHSLCRYSKTALAMPKGKSISTHKRHRLIPGTVVIASASRTYDRRFESRRVVRFLGTNALQSCFSWFYNALSW